MAKIVIYGIVDPETNQLRYVGQTCNFLKRKSAHCSMAIRNINNTHIYNWLRSLYNKNITPEFIIIEECKKEDLDSLEIFYMDYFKMIGCNLTNSSVGGVSRRGFKQTEEMRQKLSLRMKGNNWNKNKILPIKVRNKMSLSHTGKKHKKESKIKMSISKIKHKSVIQISKNGDIIKTFSSAYKASKDLNINRKSIGNVLANRSISAGGYKWVYK